MQRFQNTRWGRKWLRPRIVVVGVVLLAAAGAAMAYGLLVLSTLNAPKPASLASPSPLPSRLPGSSPIACTQTGAPIASWSGFAGPWVLPSGGGGGYVGYRAQEILAFDFVRAPNDAVGRTNVVSGSLAIDGNRLQSASVDADLSTLRSDMELRDGHIGNYLRLTDRPTARFTLTTPIALGEPKQSSVLAFVAQGRLEMLDAARDVSFALETRWNGDSIEVAGHTSINRADFGMDIPQLLQFRVSEAITVELSLRFVRPGSDPCIPPVVRSSPAPEKSSTAVVTPPPFRELTELPIGWGSLLFTGVEGSEADPFDISGGRLFLIQGGSGRPAQLVEDTQPQDQGAWSPDGQRIAYTIYADPVPLLRVVDANGANDRAVEGGEEVTGAKWSPDGKSLLAIDLPGESAIKRIDPMTGHTTPVITLPGPVSGLAISPLGDRIVFAMLPPGGMNEEIYSVSNDGLDLRRLTTDPGYDFAPAWSPDGRSIAFIRSGDLWLMNADGSGQPRLIAGLRADAPTWSPDGRHLAFVSAGPSLLNAREARRDLWFVGNDGSELARLRTDLAVVANPAWRP